jgi:hypothetical protein
LYRSVSFSVKSHRPATASVSTSAAATVITIAPSDFRKLLEEMPLLQMKVIEALAARLPDGSTGRAEIASADDFRRARWSYRDNDP